MATVAQFYDFIDSIAPFSMQMEGDCSGFLVGDSNAFVSRALCALDITEPVVAEAVELGAQLIVTHHPVIYKPLKSVTNESRTGSLLLHLIGAGISVISAHTNLDFAKGGVNDVLAEALGLQAVTIFDQPMTDALGRVGGVGRMGIRGARAPADFQGFAEFVKLRLSVDGLRGYDAGRPANKIAVLGGGGGEWIEKAAKMGCDTFITSDISHHDFHDAMTYHINVIDAGHFKTEDVVIPVLTKQLATQFPAVEVFRSEACRQPYLHY